METKETQTEEVNEYLKKFNHPLKGILESLRKIILGVNKNIGEEIKWNAPSFFFTGPMKPTNPKLYTRYLIVSNVHPKDHIMLVLPHGADVDDGSGFLEGDYKDGRRLLRFYTIDDVKSKKKQLTQIIEKLVKGMK